MSTVATGVVVACLVFATPALGAPGDLDPSFDIDGKVVTDLARLSSGHDVATQPDGKILVAGSAKLDYAIVRYLPDGSLDSGFGTGGVVSVDSGRLDVARSIALAGDGKIVIAGTMDDDFGIVRLNPDGSLDPGFDGDGLATTDLGGDESARSAAIQADGRIIVAGSTTDDASPGFVLARYNADGSPDATFGNGGTLSTDVDGVDPGATDLALQPDGKIVVVGTRGHIEDSLVALARYNPDGSLDTGLGGDGTVLGNFGDSQSADGVALQPDGKIVVGGRRYVEGESDFATMRYEANGALDQQFGTNGRALSNFGDGVHVGDVALQGDGKIVLGGYVENNFAVLRYRADGTLDKSFGESGATHADFGARDYAFAMTLQVDGRIVLTGSTEDNFSTKRDLAVARILGDRPGPAAKPFLKVLDPRKQKLGRSIKVKARCGSPCDLRATGKLVVPKPKNGELAFKLKPNSGSSAGKRETLRPKVFNVARGAAIQALKSRAKVRAELKVTATDSARNFASESRKVRITLP